VGFELLFGIAEAVCSVEEKFREVDGGVYILSPRVRIGWHRSELECLNVMVISIADGSEVFAVRISARFLEESMHLQIGTF
jgi:hypothetical protein